MKVERIKQWIRATQLLVKKWRAWVALNVPFGIRTLLGLVLVAGGVLGFLPILGFWMIPLGITVVFLDVKPLIRLLRKGRSTSDD